MFKPSGSILLPETQQINHKKRHDSNVSTATAEGQM